MSTRVAIAGAGIGGLSLALALARRGVKSVVLDQAETIEPIGAGIQLSPNASRCLAALGVLDRLSDAVVHPECVRIRSCVSGKTIARVPLGKTVAKRHGAPYLVIHRGDLQLALLEMAGDHPDIDVRLGTRLVDSWQSSDLVTLDVMSQNTSTRLDAVGLVGADGVWSAARLAVPGARQPVYTGRVAYRATIPADKVSKDLLSGTGLWFAPRTHLVHYPICGGRLFNLVAVVEGDWQEQGWSAPAGPEEVLTAFGKPHHDMAELLALPDSWLKWALCGVPGNNRWTEGRITLLGDAAHGMLPFAAQGAAMAIEDAIVLADLIGKGIAMPEALRLYEAARRPRAEKVQAEARKNDRIYHLRSPFSTARDLVLASKSPDALLARMDWVYGWRPPA